MVATLGQSGDTLTTDYWNWFEGIVGGANEDRRSLWFDYLPTEGKTLLTRFTDHSFFNVPSCTSRR